MSDFFKQRRALGTFAAFELLAAHLKDISGRKNIVWLSEAFVIPMRDNRQEFLVRMRQATQALSDAQAALYPVDARGLVGAIRVDRTGVPSFTSMATIRPNNETMEVVADATGGRAFANTNDLASAIRRASDDARVTYVLGYYAPAATDGRFRPIDVKVKRKNVIVRHRSGYFAASPPALDTKARQARVRQALEAPLQATGITLAADATRAPNSHDVELTLHIDADALSFDRDSDRWRAAVDVMIAQVDSTGRGRVSAAVPVSAALTESERARALISGITVTQAVALDATAHQVRIVVRDVASGRVGSLVIPVSKIRSRL